MLLGMRSVLLLTALAALAACKHGSPRLEGRWKGITAEGIGSESQGAADAFAAATEMDFHGDAFVLTSPKADKQFGKYKVKKDEKGPPPVVVITTERDGADDEQTF